MNDMLGRTDIMAQKRKENYGYVSPLKTQRDLNVVEDTLLHNFGNAGRRNYTIWELCKCCLLRIEDALKLRYNDVFSANGQVRTVIRTRDKKTGKVNNLNLAQITEPLMKYDLWLHNQKRYRHSPWLFPKVRKPQEHLTRQYCYNIMNKVSDLTNIQDLGTHSARKTGAYIVFRKTHNIALVMKLLNHSNESVTLRYLGLDRSSVNQELKYVDFNKISG